MLAQPARPEANTAPPSPASLRNSLRSIVSPIAVSFRNKPPAGSRSYLARPREPRFYSRNILSFGDPRARIQSAPLPPEESRGSISRFGRNRRPRGNRRQDAAPRAG